MSESFMVATPGVNAVRDMGTAGQLVADDGSWILFLQSDAHLVLYPRGHLGDPAVGVPISNRTIPGYADYYYALQQEGHIVIYEGTAAKPKGTPAIWHSNSQTTIGNFFLWVQGDGNLTINRGTSPSDFHGNHWSSRYGLAKPPVEGWCLSVFLSTGTDQRYFEGSREDAFQLLQRMKNAHPPETVLGDDLRPGRC